MIVVCDVCACLWQATSTHKERCTMELLEILLDYFGLVPLAAEATIIDCINYFVGAFGAIFIIVYFFKFLFYIVALPSNMRW